MHRLSAILIPLVLVAASCDAKKPSTDAPASSGTAKATAAATKPTAAAASEGGKMTINSSFLKMENVELKVGTAFAEVKADSIRITLVSENVGKIDCGHLWGGGETIKKGQLAIRLKTKGMGYSVPFDGKAGKYEGIGYTYYWHNEGDKGTNTGYGPKEGAKTVLEVSAIDDKTVTGSFAIKDEAKGTFTAKVCP